MEGEQWREKRQAERLEKTEIRGPGEVETDSETERNQETEIRVLHLSCRSQHKRPEGFTTGSFNPSSLTPGTTTG